MSWITAALTVGSALLGSSRSSSNTDEQNRQAAEQYAIDSAYHADLTVYQGQLEQYSALQLSFAGEQQAYANQAYQIAVANREAEIAFREEEVRNKKLSAQTEYNAQGHVTAIMQQGAESQAEAVIEDTLRVAGAERRNLTVEADRMLGVKVAKRRSGIAQGASKDRIVADAFIQRNKALGELSSKAKTSIIQTIQAKDRINNDNNIKLATSYRGLQAIMKLRPAPVANVAPPTPVFDYVAPLAPLAPLGASPVSLSSPSIIETGLTVAGGLNNLGAFSNIGSTSSSIPSVGNYNSSNLY